MKCSPYLAASLAVLLCTCAFRLSDVRGAPLPPSGQPNDTTVQSSQGATTTIPGPLRSFLRMAGISQKASPEEVLPLLARNVFLRGYQGAGTGARPTEYLILLRRYVQQARELASLAQHNGGSIAASGCVDAQPILEVLGYRVRPDCGENSTYVETADSQRAFLTIDSAFPLLDLETTLRGGPPFSYAYSDSPVPLLLTEREWMAASEQRIKGGKGAITLLDALLRDPALSRLYSAWSHLDPETQAFLERSPGLKRLMPVAASLDHYGTYIRIRSGRVIVPGGSAAEAQWRELVGASPDSPGEFVPRLLAKDNGWLAAYFDALARTRADQQAHFVENARLRRLYEAVRGKDARPSATASVFRPSPSLLLLLMRPEWDSDGQLHVPGGLSAWRTILNRKSNAEIARSWGLRIKGWKDSDGLLEALFAFSRVPGDAGPCQVFLALSELDSRRPAGHRLSPQIVELMADRFSEFGNQYLTFSEFPELSDASIALFLNTASALGRIPDHALRGDTMGIFQANLGLWQILARQGQIPGAKQDASWQRAIQPFAQISSSAQLFDAGRKSLDELSLVAGDNARASQNELVDLVAGPRQTSPAGQQAHKQVTDEIRAVLDDQRLVSVDTLFALSDGLKLMAQGAPAGKDLVPLAARLREFQMPRPIFSRGERAAWAAGIYDNRHTDLQMRTDLAKVIESPAHSANLGDARGQLVPFLRDALVGLNYAYYEPPGSQALHNNPLLVRSHDFSGETIIGMDRMLWQPARLTGTGSPAGGGAHLVGSLADLPYVLGRLEQDFVAPDNVQALIWSDLVPAILANAVLARWWDVTGNELHAVALYQRTGEELLKAAAENPALRDQVTSILSERMYPQTSARLGEFLRTGGVAEGSSEITPADLFYLAAEYRRRFSSGATLWGPAGSELEDLSRRFPDETNWERLSRDFGVPHPILARTYARELLNDAPLPVFEGYSSQLLAETWDSPNLYWARLADEMGYAPVALNRLVPALTVRMVANIFATDLDDSPALLRAMRETGEEFRQGRLASPPANSGSAASSITPSEHRSVN